MTTLNNYQSFDGRHWETGTVRNSFAQQGIIAPHTGQPISEALLMGISGGAVMGYFSFAYEGYDPMARVLTRNTFDPMPRLLDRLGIVRDVLQTGSAAKAEKNLIDVLENGEPAIVWADMWGLPYNALDYDDGMWGMMPVLVYGYDKTSGTVSIADRARVPLTVSIEKFATARARVKKDRFRLMTLSAPNFDKLSAAVSAGIWDCIKLYTESPPKGSKNNFGLLAFEHWASLLTKSGARKSWAKVFPVGIERYAGLTSVFTDIVTFAKDENGTADRDIYADFLEEAAILLERPGLGDAATKFRESSAVWGQLADTLLPADAPIFGEANALLREWHALFLAEGSAALDRVKAIKARLAEIRASMEAGYPHSEADSNAHLAGIADVLISLRNIEAEAVQIMQDAMA